MIFPSVQPDDRKVRVFSLNQSFLEQFEGKQPAWGFGGLGYFTYKRTYARVKENGSTEEWWETCQRVVQGVYNIQKIHCRTLRLPWNEPKAQRSAQDMFQRMWDFKFLPPGRGLWVMGTDVVFDKGAAALNNCFASETEFITSEGVKTLGACVGTTQTILSRKGAWIDAPIRSFGEQKLWRVVLSRQGVEKELFCTEDHRWFARDRRQAHRNGGHAEFKTSELRPEVHRLQYVFGQGIKSIEPSPFGIAHGVVFGDGTRVPGERNDNRIVLCGEKNAHLAEFFRGCPISLGEDSLIVTGIPNAFKEAPSIHETKSYLLGWLMGYFAADGKMNGTPVLSSTSKKDLEAARDVCVALGIGTFGIRPEDRISNLTGEPSTLYNMALMRDTLTTDFFLMPHHRENYESLGGEKVTKRYWTVMAVEETDRTEEVFCATVEGERAFALEGNILTGNCGFTSTEGIDIDFADPFCFLMDMSMLGVGVGGDTRGAGKVKIQVPRFTNDMFVVEDSREGWVDLVRTILNSFIGKGYYPTTIDFSQVRVYGSAIKGFGGKASGPGPLKDLVKNLTRLLMPTGVGVTFNLEDHPDHPEREGEEDLFYTTPDNEPEGEGYRLTSTIIVDIFNYVGKAVVAGGVRRSAEIMFGDPADKEFMALKQDQKALEDRRWASNNSIFGEVGMDYAEVARAIAVNGEPGIAWLENSRSYSRMGRAPDHKDDRAMGCNPCVEQTLEDQELCCLVETFPANAEDFEDYRKTLKMAYLYAKTVTLVPTHNTRTNAVLMRNRRIGCSMSGIIQAMKKLGRRQFLKWCGEGYGYIRDLDKIYADWLCVPRSIKMTSVKPSGTVSLLVGATPGIHYPHSEHYIRNIRVDGTSPLVTRAREAGYPVEVDTYAEDTWVVSFPVKEEHFVKGKAEASMWEQFANAADIQRHWADNQVSCTVTFKPEEIPDIQPCLEVFETQLKAISMLPLWGHGYKQAPYITIDEAEYGRLMANIKPLDLSDAVHEVTDKLCSNDTCELVLPTK